MISLNQSDLDNLQEIASTVHHIMWNRFMDSYHIIYDYVGLNGEVCLPTPEECEMNKPSALGYWTPIEDGAFFTGLYLDAQCGFYELNKTEERREEIQKLIRGLYKLQDVCETPGFICRGVGTDGQCHYPASSNDQNLPWIAGLWRYLRTDIPSPVERKECEGRLIGHINALKENNWIIPGDQIGFETANMRAMEGFHGSLSAPHLIFTAKIHDALAGDDEEKLYKYFLNEVHEGKTRKDIIAAGVPFADRGQAWFISNSQYAIHQLYRWETDPGLKKIYARSLRATAENAVPSIAAYKDYPLNERKSFTPEWHIMLEAWRSQKNYKEAWDLSIKEQLPIWNQACPAIGEEKRTILTSIPGAWIVLMSEDEQLIESTMAEILNAIRRFDYAKSHYAGIFFVENLIREILAISSL